MLASLRAHGSFARDLRAARAAVAQGERAEAERRYRDLLARRADDAGAAFELANLLLERHWLEEKRSQRPDFAALAEALELYALVNELTGYHAEARLGMAEVALALGQDDMAGEIFLELARRAPEQPRVRLRLAQLLARREEWRLAARFLASIANDPALGEQARAETRRIERAAFGEAIDWEAFDTEAFER